MAIKFERVKAGDVLFDKQRRKMGNTTMSADYVFKVEVVEVDPAGFALVRWNGNPAQWWHRNRVEKLYRKEPKTRRNPFDSWHRAARKEGA